MAKAPAAPFPASHEVIQTPANKAPAGKATPDWERIELEYRAGIQTLRQIAEAHGITHGAINKRAKVQGWTRDLNAKIQAKADALVSKAAVSTEVSKEAKIAEKAVIDANAQAVADVRLAHRRDIHRARKLTNALLDELEQQTNPVTLGLLTDLGELLEKPDEKTGRDKLNELYMAIISLPERSKTMKLLAESLQKLVDMERLAFNMDAKTPAEGAEATRFKQMNDAERAVRMASILNGGPAAEALMAILQGKKAAP